MGSWAGRLSIEHIKMPLPSTLHRNIDVNVISWRDDTPETTFLEKLSGQNRISKANLNIKLKQPTASQVQVPNVQ